MKSLEVEQGIPRPKAAGNYLLAVLQTYGRQEDRSVPPTPVPVSVITELEDEKNLWFGPGVDAIDYIFTQVDRGVVVFDRVEGTFTWIGEQMPPIK